MPEGEDKKETVEWMRGPKKANLGNVDVHKLIKAKEERGVEIGVPAGGKGKSTVIKTAVTGMPAPKKKEE